MKILITGGGGFQGSHLTEFLLSKGHQITILNTLSGATLENLAAVKNKIVVVWGSVTDKELVDKTVREHDLVIHMAAHINVDESLRDSGVFLRVNVLGTHHVLEAVKAHGSRLIYVSTCEVYGDGHHIRGEKKLDEFAELRPNSPYA